jgi:DedD protein
LETRAKERLTGAVILVALIVLLVPELLSGPVARPPTATAAGADEPLASYTFGLSDESHGVSKVPERDARAVDRPGGSQVSASAASPAGEPSAARTASTAVSSSSAAPSSSATGNAAAASAAPSAARHSSSASAHAAHNARPGAGWWIQLGSFTSRANAERLAQQLKAQGFSASIAEGTDSGRKWYRVRSGPERDHTAAQALARRLRDSGHAGTLVPSP